MFQTFDDSAAFIRDNKIEMVDLKFSDLWGRWHHVTLSAEEFSPRTLTSGVGFDGSSVGLKSVKSGDMALIPDLSTGFVDPFWEAPTMSFICIAVEADTNPDTELKSTSNTPASQTGVFGVRNWNSTFSIV